MRQESNDNSYFETHWDRIGKVRTLFPANKGKVQYPAEPKILGMEEDRMGGLVGFIKAESSNAAYRIAQDHMLCIFMDKRECKHIKSSDSKSANQEGAK